MNIPKFYTYSQLSGYRFLKTNPRNWKDIRDLRFYIGSRPFIHHCKVRGLFISIVVDGRMELYRALTYETKEPETLDWLDRYVRPGDVVYDIGANIGIYSLYIGMKLREKVLVYAFEPEAFNFAKLNRNIIENKLQGTVIPFNIALAEKTDVGYLYSRDVEVGAAMHEFREAIDSRGHSFEPAHQQGVGSCSLDQIHKYDNISFPDHLKIDVDGIEGLIIHGATETLADRRLRSLLIELNPREEKDMCIFEILARSGFELSYRTYTGPSSQNCIFVRKDS